MVLVSPVRPYPLAKLADQAVTISCFNGSNRGRVLFLVSVLLLGQCTKPLNAQLTKPTPLSSSDYSASCFPSFSDSSAPSSSLSSSSSFSSSSFSNHQFPLSSFRRLFPSSIAFRSIPSPRRLLWEAPAEAIISSASQLLATNPAVFMALLINLGIQINLKLFLSSARAVVLGFLVAMGVVLLWSNVVANVPRSTCEESVCSENQRRMRLLVCSTGSAIVGFTLSSGVAFAVILHQHFMPAINRRP
eukprot:GHVS01107109.1.p1 GENE.GHVS01107109.1~~GHVS01107109.1.p1  ORF type:complete len:246 (+),score=33.01 GHVS01107109.1:208-945(+)